MKPILQEIETSHSPETLALALRRAGLAGLILLRTGTFDTPASRYSFVAADPFVRFRASGSRCEVWTDAEPRVSFGDPWHVLDSLMARYELLDEMDLPFPLGGCFGFWGYDLKNFSEPRLPRHAPNDLELPDCHVGFYDSLVAFDHALGKCWIISTGACADGSRSAVKAAGSMEFWQRTLQSPPQNPDSRWSGVRTAAGPLSAEPESNMEPAAFVDLVARAKEYIRLGHIYQVNLSHRLAAPFAGSGWELFLALTGVSPAPFSAYLDCGDFELASSSPEQFLQISGRQIQTRPIKGTRPRASDPVRDGQLGYELQTSPKENAELVMITDLLRNDLGRVCQFGTVQVPELMRLERYPHVQHLVSTVRGTLRPEVTHFAAFRSCFPGGSITGAPKFRAMEIIDELEPVSRGPYTGSIGYLGFNRESQLSITIRAGLVKNGFAYFNVGAGIVADSDPEMEYRETLAKAGGFLAATQSRAMSQVPCAAGKLKGD